MKHSFKFSRVLGANKTSDAKPMRLGRVIVAGLQELIDNLQARGTKADVIENLKHLPQDKLPIYVNRLNQDPSLDWNTLEQSVFVPQSKATSWTPMELQLVARYDDLFQKWALTQLRKLRLEPDENGGYVYRLFTNLNSQGVYENFNNLFGEIYDWYRNQKIETPRLDITSYNLSQALEKSNDWHQMIAGKGEGKIYTPLKRDENGEIIDERVVYQWEDGWFMTMVTNKNDLAVEGNQMSHCVGSYCYQVERGDIRIFSLRSPDNKPHVTIEMDGKTNTILQIKGFGNKTPDSKDRERISEWFGDLGDAEWSSQSPFEEEIDWGSSKEIESIVAGIYDSAYGAHYDEDVVDDDYGIPYKQVEKDIRHNDIETIYENVSEALTDVQWDPTTRKQVPTNIKYTNNMDVVAKTMIEVAMKSDIANMSAMIANPDEIHKPFALNFADWESKSNKERGIYWWMNTSNVKTLYDNSIKSIDEYKKEYRINTAELYSNPEHQQYITSTLPYGLDMEIQSQLGESIDDEYMSLFEELTGYQQLPILLEIKKINSADYPKLFTHVDDLSDQDMNDPKFDQKFDGTWKYSKRKQLRQANKIPSGLYNQIQSMLILSSACDKKGMYRMADQLMTRVTSMQRTANEWWLKDGEAVYADGDVGDINHEMLAEEEMLNRLGFDIENHSEWPITREHAYDIFRNNIRDLDDYNQHLTSIHNGNGDAIENAHEDADLYEYLLWKKLKQNPKLDPKEAREQMDKDWDGFRDPRTYALKNFGWHRVQGKHVETYNLNKASLQEIARGLYDAYGDDAERMQFYIESHNPRKYIGPVSIDDIETGKVLRESIGPDSSEEVSVRRRPANPYYKYEGG